MVTLTGCCLHMHALLVQSMQSLSAQILQNLFVPELFAWAWLPYGELGLCSCLIIGTAAEFHAGHQHAMSAEHTCQSELQLCTSPAGPSFWPSKRQAQSTKAQVVGLTSMEQAGQWILSCSKLKLQYSCTAMAIVTAASMPYVVCHQL